MENFFNFGEEILICSCVACARESRVGGGVSKSKKLFEEKNLPNENFWASQLVVYKMVGYADS